ncbi:MAG: peptidylprolyl isomerase [Candidatus Rokubacteria bacterium]|nr:peptidylprolyl isomerase [Candidatus Rokubacteria bacterium]
MRRLALIVLLAVLLPVGFAAAQAPKPAPKAPSIVVAMETGGEFTMELWPDVAPHHVKNFVDLAGTGFYDGQRVHRVEPRFVVQFGDPQSKTLPMNDPKMGTGGSDKKIKAEFNKRPFVRGVLGMARTSDPDSASSQVYVMTGDAPSLNGQYTAFGKVTKGMDVVDRIKVGDRIKSVKVQ